MRFTILSFKSAQTFDFTHTSFIAFAGVVPLCSAHLEGATQINLPGIYHSINAPDQWYGSDAVIDSWHTEMIRQIEQRQGTGIQVPSKASS